MEVDESMDCIENLTLKCELNTLSRADGSCILCHSKNITSLQLTSIKNRITLKICFFFIDENIMAAAVYGPVEVKLHKLLIDKATIEVMFKRQCGQSRTFILFIY